MANKPFPIPFSTGTTARNTHAEHILTRYTAVHNLTDICWTKCITGAIKSKGLDKSEESCAKNCVDRFLDANFLVIKQLENVRQQ